MSFGVAVAIAVGALVLWGLAMIPAGRNLQRKRRRLAALRGPRTTTVPFRQWPWHARLVERLYRWTHGGQIRTLVVHDWRYPR